MEENTENCEENAKLFGCLANATGAQELPGVSSSFKLLYYQIPSFDSTVGFNVATLVTFVQWDARKIS